MKDGFRETRKGLTEETRELIKKWSKKDLEDFTEYLYENRQKDRREKTAKVTGVSKEKMEHYSEL